MELKIHLTQMNPKRKGKINQTKNQSLTTVNNLPKIEGIPLYFRE